MKLRAIVHHLAIFVCIIVPGYFDTVRNPEIIEIIRPEVKKKGDTAILRCTVSFLSAANKVVWLFLRPDNSVIEISRGEDITTPNDPIDIKAGATATKYSIVKLFGKKRGNDVLTFQLVIRRLQTEDGGRYMCRIDTQGVDANKSPHKIGMLTVQSPPQILASGTTNTKTVSVNQSFTLECLASGVPKPVVRWKRADGKRLPNGEQEKIGRDYLIKRVKGEDRGVYRCVASNNVIPPAEHDATLIVKYQPSIRALQDTVGQAESRNFRVDVECLATGDPPPTVYWSYIVPNSNGVREALTKDEKYDMKQTPWPEMGPNMMLNTLTIKNVRSNDFSTYYCLAKNELGQDEAQIQVYETAQCQGVRCWPGKDIGAAHSTTFSSFTLLSAVVLYFIIHSVYL